MGSRQFKIHFYFRFFFLLIPMGTSSVLNEEMLVVYLSRFYKGKVSKFTALDFVGKSVIISGNKKYIGKRMIVKKII